MYIEAPWQLFKPCIIKPLDDHEGMIVCIKHDICLTRVLVRYFMHGAIQHNWFFDFEVEIKKHNNHNKDFFKEY